MMDQYPPEEDEWFVEEDEIEEEEEYDPAERIGVYPGEEEDREPDPMDVDQRFVPKAPSWATAMALAKEKTTTNLWVDFYRNHKPKRQRMLEPAWNAFDKDCFARNVPRNQNQCGGAFACTFISCLVGYSALRWMENYSEHYKPRQETAEERTERLERIRREHPSISPYQLLLSVQSEKQVETAESFYERITKLELPLWVSFDKAVFAGSKFWSETDGSFCSVFDVIRKCPPIAMAVEIVREDACLASSETRSSHFDSDVGGLMDPKLWSRPPSVHLLSPREHLEQHWRPLKETTFFVCTRAGYSFTGFWIPPYYTCHDSHQNAYEARKHALPADCPFEFTSMERWRNGLLFRTIDFDEMVSFVNDYVAFNFDLSNKEELNSNQMDIIILKLKPGLE